MEKRILLCCLLFVLFQVDKSIGQTTVKLQPATKTVALTNATIVQKPGKVIENGSVVIKNGLIAEVGKDVVIPSDAKVITGDSLYVYAGFIDGLGYTGVPRAKTDEESSGGQRRRGPPPGVKDRGNPPNKVAGITPHQSVADLLKPDDRSVKEMRELGFTAAHVVPRGQMLPGKGAIVLLKGETGKEMILKDKTSLFAQLSGARRVYPATIIGVMAKFRDLYIQAEIAGKHERAYEADPSGMQRPTYSKEHQALYPVVTGKQPVFFAAEDIKSIHRTMLLQQDLGFSLVLANVKQGWHVLDKIKSNANPVFLSLDMPQEKGNNKKKQPAEGKAVVVRNEAGEETANDEKKALEKRQQEELQKRLSQASKFAEAGIQFGFSTLTAKTKNIRKDLGRLISNGLSADQALAALTTAPAKMLGVAGMLGSVEKGKIGNLVVTDNPYFTDKTNVRYVVVEGKVFEYAVKKKPKGGTSAKVNPAGSWSYELDADGEKMEGSLQIKNESGGFAGTISNPVTRESTPIGTLELEGNALSFSVQFEADGETVSVDFYLVMDDNGFEGSATASGMGTFDIEGERTSDPE